MVSATATKFLLTALALAAGVAAHGYVQEITLGSTLYTGYLPYNDVYVTPTPERLIRKIPGNGPIEDLTLIDLQCNGWSEGGYVGSAPAPLVGTIAAGETVTFNWTAWPDSHKGPILTYLARAPDGVDIRKWEPGTDAVWFKIDHAGKDKDEKWAADEFLTTYSVKIPPKLKPGQYIIRHEILALHSAYAYPGIQSYPSCAQVQVTGNGSAFPASFVSFPGEYTPETPGVIFNIYNGWQPPPYPIPGPEVWTGGN
ncbi:glycoside hydrolase family 61 protein [Ephemerocybe angulata]|uniref:lytic cellulose monooxygenase (C4-dehydrogenating) n=1 Tax=Ephemerocybe angulata TaxID=980116 RepID=A0A8H6HEC5_9AGAR|nr:glycoside hydrolase family 61 protein [Tulosesus angulatus]